jgi:Helix-turn-helix domain
MQKKIKGTSAGINWTGALFLFERSSQERPPVSEYTNLDDAKELARFLKMSVAWVRKASRNGLPHVKVGRAVRFDRGQVLAHLQARQKQN